MPNATDQQIRALIESFVSRLSEQVREAAVESVREAFGGGAAPSPGPAIRTRREAGAEKTAPQARSTGRKKGGKRDPEMVFQNQSLSHWNTHAWFKHVAINGVV